MRQYRTLVAVIVVGMLFLAAIGVVSASKSDSARKAAVASQRGLEIQTKSAQRTECFRDIGAILDHERWELIGDAFTATSPAEAVVIGNKLRLLPTNVFLGEHGGRIGIDAIVPCPPSPVERVTVKEKP